MMINDCGHPICKNCVENIFARNSAPCPVCGKQLRKNYFWEQKFDNPLIEREVYHRKRLSKIFCLKHDEFQNDKAYNDYLERFETIICNYVDDIDLEKTDAEVRQFQAQYADAIERNRKKLSEDDLWIKQMLEEDEDRHRRVNAELQNESNNEKKKNVDDANKEVLEELKSGNLPAEVIVDKKRKLQIEQEMLARDEERKKKLTKITSRHDKVTFGAVAASGAPYIHKAPRLYISGPPLPATEEMHALGYSTQVGTLPIDKVASGFTPELAVIRYLHEARQDLFVGI
uniref:CDK-activating kinase assembly factor MAT1 n=1 Tax=Panagrellus redivivus TaxID=6233 RepID=A0A7E4VZJ5_PANRE